MTGLPGTADFEITLTVKAQKMPKNGCLHIRRDAIKNDFSEVIRTVMEKKVTKLAEQPADKRVLILERQHMNLVPKQILDEVRRQAADFPLMASIDEVWILETIGYKLGGHFLFELIDDNDRQVGTITCEGSGWTSRLAKTEYRSVTTDCVVRKERHFDEDECLPVVADFSQKRVDLGFGVVLQESVKT